MKLICEYVRDIMKENPAAGAELMRLNAKIISKELGLQQPFPAKKEKNEKTKGN